MKKELVSILKNRGNLYKRNLNFGCLQSLKKQMINDKFSVAELKEGTYEGKTGGSASPQVLILFRAITFMLLK